jgi:hypothetical protein
MVEDDCISETAENSCSVTGSTIISFYSVIVWFESNGVIIMDLRLEEVCKECGGSGKVYDKRYNYTHKCYNCDGIGYKPSEVGLAILKLIDKYPGYIDVISNLEHRIRNLENED